MKGAKEHATTTSSRLARNWKMGYPIHLERSLSDSAIMQNSEIAALTSVNTGYGNDSRQNGPLLR